MPPPTLSLTSRIYPDPAQAAQLRRMWRTVLTAQLALSTYLQHRAAGSDVLLSAAATGALGAATSPGGTPLPELSSKELEAVFQAARDQLGWAHTVPPSALRWMVRETARAWRTRPPGTVPAPWPVHRPLELHLDHAVQVDDDVTLSIAGLTGSRLPADLFFPRIYWRALIRHQRRRLAAECERQAELERRWFAGDAGAAAELLARRARLGQGADLPDPGEPSVNEPISRERVVIRWVQGDGRPPRWEAQWSFGVGHVPFRRWTHDDVLGVDLGLRHVFAIAAQQHGVQVRRPFRGPFSTPQLPAHLLRSLPPADLARAQARHRRSLFLQLLPAYEAQLAGVLRYRGVALEAMAWDGFRRRGSPFGEYAEQVGLIAWLDWVRALAPWHGTGLLWVQPEYTSRTCSRCGQVRSRPRRGFRCAACGHSAPADLNAAAVIRARGLAQLGRS